MPKKKEPEYALVKIKIGNNPPQGIILKIIDPSDIPKSYRQRKHMPPEIKQALIKAGFRKVTQTSTKHK